MSVEALVAPIRQVPLFQGLSNAQLSEIARRAERIVFRPGDTIVADHEEGDAAYIIVSGDAIRTRSPGPAAMAADLVAPGSLLGEMAMFIEVTYTSTVVAKSSVRALKITRKQMLDQMAEDSCLADHFVSIISERLRRLAAELSSIERTLGHSERHLAPESRAQAVWSSAARH